MPEIPRIPGYRSASVDGPDEQPLVGAPPSGGATVQRAVRVVDDQPVALKIFAGADVDRAEREAAIGQAIDHPHVVAALDIVTTHDEVALVMPWASGGSLAALLAARHRLPWPQVLTVLIPVADALAAAHERGFVHGDVSAANVVFDGDGRPLLADFGAGRAAAECGGEVAVTPTDVAPEVARGASPDAAADLFALGSVALRCVTGRPAWPADDLRDVVVQATAGQWPDLDDHMAPEELRTIVRRLLAAEPAERGSAAQLAVDLRDVGDPEPVELVPEAVERAGRSPLPATQVRPDAIRPPAVTPSPGGPRRRRSGLRVSGLRRPGLRRPRRRRSGSGRSARHERRSAGHERRSAGQRRERRAATASGAERAPWRVLAAVVVACGLLTGAIAVGWWSSGRRTGAATLAAGPDVVEDHKISDEIVEDHNRPEMMAGSDDRAGSGRSVGGRSVGGRSVGGEDGGHNAASPAEADPPSHSTADTADWQQIVAALDRARSDAFVHRDPDLLASVYLPEAVAQAADAQRIRGMVAAEYSVSGAVHHIEHVTWIRRGPGGEAVVAVVETLPGYDVYDAAGTVVGRTEPRSTSAVRLDLAPTADGFRISAIDALESSDEPR